MDNKKIESNRVERRKIFRSEEKILIVGNLLPNHAEKFKALTANLSVAGLMFETERKIPEESRLRLEIHQPIRCDKRVIVSIPVLAKVIWIKKIEKDNFEQGENKYKVGIEFLKLEEENKRRISDYLKGDEA